MEEHKKVPIAAVIILAVALFGAIFVFVLRKQTLISPIPEGASVRVIFTSPPPTQTPVPTEPISTPAPTKKVTPTISKVTGTPKPTVKPTVILTVTPTP